MVAIDTSVFVLLLDPKAKAPNDPNTQVPISNCQERISFLVETLTNAGTRILVPTPVMSEFLVKAGPNFSEYLATIHASKSFRVEGFDERAAIELAFMEQELLGKPRQINATETKAKLKFDRQILAIAKVNGATTIYTDDQKLAKHAIVHGIKPVMTWELPLPPRPIQGDLLSGTDPDFGSW